MRLRLLLRRLTVSSPRMAVRSALPWPFRWAVLALVAGFCAAIGLWAFEFGKGIAGLDRGSREDMQKLHAALASLQADLDAARTERDKVQSIANTASTLLTSEKVTQERLSLQNKQLEAENRRLRDDLGFFEKLIPSKGVSPIAIRGLQAEMQSGRVLKWQVLVMQAVKDPPEFNGRLDLSFSGLQNGQPWEVAMPGGARVLKLKQYARLDGVLELPPGTLVKELHAKVLEGTVTRAVQTSKL